MTLLCEVIFLNIKKSQHWLRIPYIQGWSGLAPIHRGRFRRPSCWKRVCKKFKLKKTGMEWIRPDLSGTVSKTIVLKRVCKKFKLKKNRDGGDRTPGYGSEDRRVAITPHPYFSIILINPFSSTFKTSSFHSLGISGFVLMNLINSFFTFKTSSYLLIFNHFSIGS